MGQDNFYIRGNLTNSFSALTLSGRDEINNNLINEEGVLHQIEQQEQEILQLKEHLAEYAVKEAQIQNEKRVLENRIALMLHAFDQQEQDLIEATSKAISYRQEIIEENIHIEYALQVAQEERSIFISSLVTLLSNHSLHPGALDAHSIVSNLRILFKHNKERLVIAEEKLRESQYQPRVLHSNTRELPLNNSSHPEWTPSSFSPSPEADHLDLERPPNKEDVVNSHYLPSILEEDQEPSSSSHLEADYSEEDDNESGDYDGVDINKPLPTIEGLQILGDPFPGNEIQASGYSRNGTTHCGFEWVRHLQDGSVIYIEGAKQPTYTVTADDVDTYLAVEVQPLDDRQRKGEHVRCFANDNKKITCHPDSRRQIENTLKIGHAAFKVFVWKVSLDTWQPANLEIKKKSYSIKLNGPNNGVVVDSKYTPNTVISLQPDFPLGFSILSTRGVEEYLRADYSSTDIRCSRDTIVLIMRSFVKRAVDKKLGKKRRVLFFK